MYLRKNLHKLITASMIAGSLTFAPDIYGLQMIIPIAHAEVKMYTGIGEGITSDIESPSIAKLRARADAMKNAQDQAGVYLKSYSHSINALLVDDEISAITNNIVEEIGETQYEVKTVPVSDKITLIHYKAMVKVNIDTNGISNYLNRDSQTKTNIVNQNKELKKSIEENNKQLEDLRKQAMNATAKDEREKIKSQFESVDKDFLSNQKVEEGNRLRYKENSTENMRKVIRCYDEAIELNPNNSSAYSGLGYAYKVLENFKEALENLNKALQLDPNNYYAYANRGDINIVLGNTEQAIADFDKSIKINPNYDEVYYYRAIYYYYFAKDNDKALNDLNKAIELNAKNDTYYYYRGMVYTTLKQYNQAISDYTRAIQFRPNLHSYYYFRGLAYKSLGENAKAQADFAKAKELGHKG